ncbi:hypothetical protein [Companilactobacillus furfuricola]|uniref:hypothetical protein n=1 Tax=Companilactobacillus furfuricola TaxID=1462575 RepID=UPI000F785B65|nr:hypothetical protein [Companilactobacillus furfuricola]
MADRRVLLGAPFVSLLRLEVVVWLLRSMPTPGPGDTDAGTWWAHFEPIEQSTLACFKTAPSSKLLRRQDEFHH